MNDKNSLLIKQLCREIAEESQKFDQFFKLMSINHKNIEQSKATDRAKSAAKANSRWKKKQMLH